MVGSFRNRAADVMPVLLKGIENPKELDVFRVCFHGLKLSVVPMHPLIKAAIDRGEADFFREHLESIAEGRLQMMRMC